MTCEAPVQGFERMEQSAAARGLDLSYTFVDPTDAGSCFQVPGPVIATDLDGDGDADLVFHELKSLPHVFMNEGGSFVRVEPWAAPWTQGDLVLTLAAADLDGDGLPELLFGCAGSIQMSRNLGGGQFAAPENLYVEEGYPKSCASSLVTGDVDGDGDLDLLVTTLHAVPAEGVPASESSRDGAPDLLLLNDDGVFSLAAELIRRGVPGLAFLGAFTDRDHDGDLDVLLTSDRPENGLPPTAFYANEGLGSGGAPILRDVMDELGVDPFISGMGLVSTDFNDDGALDYCISDIGAALRCWVSDGDGYVDRGTAMGLIGPDPATLPDDWVPWSVAMADFDGDGELDMATTAGGYGDQFSPDRMWRGRADGTFEDRSAETGFDSPAGHFGMAMADFDRDGFPDLAVRPGSGPVEFWDNPCGDGAWVEVDLRGPAGNHDGFGARVTVTAGGTADVREMHGLRALGQGDSTLHFGLGSADSVDLLRVVWTDGEVTEAEGLGVRRRIEVSHPSLL